MKMFLLSPRENEASRVGINSVPSLDTLTSPKGPSVSENKATGRGGDDLLQTGYSEEEFSVQDTVSLVPSTARKSRGGWK